MSSNIPSNYYVDNDKLVEALMQHKKNCRVAKRKKLPEPLLTNFIGECFLKIVVQSFLTNTSTIITPMW